MVNWRGIAEVTEEQDPRTKDQEPGPQGAGAGGGGGREG